MLALDQADTIKGNEPHRHAAFGTTGMGRKAVRRPHEFAGFILDRHGAHSQYDHVPIISYLLISCNLLTNFFHRGVATP